MTGRAYQEYSKKFSVLAGSYATSLARAGKSIAVAAGLLGIVSGLALVSNPGKAAADSFYIGAGGIGFSFGGHGYRGSFFYGGRGFFGPPYRPYGYPYYYHPYDGRAYPYRSRVYVNPPVRLAPRYAPAHRGAPQRVPHTKTGLRPFTPAYTAYCSRKYKSFDPHTGTYLAYSGRFRFCR